MSREIVAERQKEIFRFIEKNPGTHLREIQRRLSISSMGNLEYHINNLRKLRLVVEKVEGGYKRYYPVYRAVKNKELLALLRQKTPRQIAILILENMRINGCLEVKRHGITGENGIVGRGEAENRESDDEKAGESPRGVAVPPDDKKESIKCGLTPFELMGELGLSPSALSYYLSKMRKKGILRKERHGKNVYYLLNDPDIVLGVLISYRESFMDRLVNSFMETWGL